jgi:hypothetical protein
LPGWYHIAWFSIIVATAAPCASGHDEVRTEHATAGLAIPMPALVDIMMDNPDHDWGKPFYPVIET